MNTMTPVLVMRCDHYGALGVMRSLGRLGVDVYGVHLDTLAPALRSRYCRRTFVLDLEREPAAHSVARLCEIAHAIGRRAILLPTNDEGAMFVADHASALREAFLFQDNDATLVRTLYDKRAMHDLVTRLGIPTARTEFPACRADVEALAASARFPVMLKGADGISLARRSGLKMVIARGPAELLEAYDRLEDPVRPDLMVQEYIPGGEDSQWMFDGYFDTRAECVFGVTGRKLRQTPVYTGMTSLGVCLRNDTVERQTLELARAVGYRGILDIGYRFDARDGRYKVLDVNPRIGATFRLFVGDGGLDVARALYLDLTGQEVPRETIQEGRRWFVEDLDLASSIKYHKDGVLEVGDWARSFAGVREAAWWAADDPAPFVAMCGRVAAVARKKLGQRALPERATESHGTRVRAHFAGAADYWRDVYRADRLLPLIYRDREATALELVERLAPHGGAHILEIGCGAGHAAVALARLGHGVDAIDVAPEMIAQARRAAVDAGATQVVARVGDVHSLDFPAAEFDLVLALGVLPWLHSDRAGLAEMARVLKPGGHVILTADNRACLSRLVDPRSTPALAPLRTLMRRALDAGPPPAPVVKDHEPHEVDRLVAEAGLEKVRAGSVGFGPFSILGRRVLNDRIGMKLHRRLQRLADRGAPLLATRGRHYIVVARKPL
jgi:predicted ATP-grasp superfamily ATP-dependent carboligase/SAM-dependent methyltransferase